MNQISGHTEVAKILIEKGTNVNAEDLDKWTPLHTAVKYGH